MTIKELKRIVRSMHLRHATHWRVEGADWIDSSRIEECGWAFVVFPPGATHITGHYEGRDLVTNDNKQCNERYLRADATPEHVLESLRDTEREYIDLLALSYTPSHHKHIPVYKGR